MFGLADILYKRNCFSHEKEFRVWFTDDELLNKIERNETVDESALSPGMLVTITDMKRMIKSLVVAPGAEEWFINVVKGVCGAYKRTWLASLVVRSSSDRTWDSFST